jgi:hypothetical protein
MLYHLAVFACLFAATFGDHNPQSVEIGEPWSDFVFCDHDEWDFEHNDPNIHAIHRDGVEDMITYCYYGEFAGDGNEGNNYAMTYLNFVDSNDDIYTGELTIMIHFRLWAWCNWRNSERIRVYAYDQYNRNPNQDNTDAKNNPNNYDNSQLLHEAGKRDNTCSDNNAIFDWDEQAVSGAPDWYDEVPCVDGQVSCYRDVWITITFEGGVLGLRWETDMTETIETAAWAFSDVHVTWPPSPAPPCCTGTRDDKPNKSCGAFHEERNCENKGCDWSQDRQCQIPCCRFDVQDGHNTEKPQCKSFNSPPNNVNQQACNDEDACDMTVCDVIGMGNNSDGL